MRSGLLTFHHIRGNHIGQFLVCTLLYLLDWVGVTLKASHFTFNNAKNNIMMMKHLKGLLAEHELPLEFHAQDRCTIYFPHVINICVQHIIDMFSDPDLEKIALTWVSAFNGNMVDKDFYIKAVKKNPVALGHAIICVIHASGLWHDEFSTTVQSENLHSWFKTPASAVAIISEFQLLLDIRTQWNSMYFMINHLHALWLVVDWFLSMPAQLDIVGYKMTKWNGLFLKTMNISLILHERDLVIDWGEQWVFSEGGAYEETQRPQRNTEEDQGWSRF